MPAERILWLKDRVTDVRYGLKDDFEEGFLKKPCLALIQISR
jgi:hypothetical protein